MAEIVARLPDDIVIPALTHPAAAAALDIDDDRRTQALREALRPRDCPPSRLA